MSDMKIIIGTKTYSSWSLRGWLAAKHTGLDFEEVKLPLDAPEFYERIGDLSPNRCVPCLHDGDIRVWDSLAIIDYCARLAPDRYWWPENAEAYAMARSIAAEMHSGFAALRKYAPMNMSKTFTGLDLSDAVRTDVERVDAIWQECRGKFGARTPGSTGPFLFGDFSAADIMYAPVVSRFMTYGIKVSDVSKAYMANMDSHPYIDAWRLDAQREDHIVTADEIDPNTKVLGE